MEFSVKERLVLGGILPREGKDYVTLTLASNLGDKLKLTSEEIEAIGMKTGEDGKSLTWKPDAPDKDIPLGVKTVQMVKDTLLAIEKDNKLSIDLLTLYRKFVGSPTVED